jgi:hypothetical protein
MRYLLVLIIALPVLVAGYSIYLARIVNPRVVRELRENPDGERARRVMLIALPSGRVLPVNYIREGGTLYAAADGRWWRALRGEGAAVEVLVRGETHAARARAIEDDPARRSAVFDRLRPSAPKLFGTLVQIELSRPP